MKKILSSIWDNVKRIDKILILLCLTACAFSVLLLYSMYVNGVQDITEYSYKTQIIAISLGVGAMLVLAVIDYKKLSKLWFLYAPVALILVLLLFTPLGISRNGADDIGWLDLGVTTVQPSELMKIAYIMTFSTHLYKVGDKMNKLPQFILLCIHGIAPAAIVSVQGDDGTALVFLCMFVVMMFVAGLSWKYITLGVVSVPILVYIAWNYLMQPHHKQRFLILFDPELQQQEISNLYYQQYWGKIALASGGLEGQGLWGGKYVHVPEIRNDFIFSYIGMTLGLIGCVFTVVLLLVICLKILSVASLSKDNLGKFICIGVFTMILFHSIINIGMVLSVVPVIGIPLPFISSGGTSTLSMLASIGLVLSVYAHRSKNYHMFYNEKD